MLSLKIVRPLFAVFLTCAIALNSFISPAFADNGSAVNSFVNDFGDKIVDEVGKAVAFVAICYAVNVLIVPFAPPIAPYLPVICPGIGSAVVGGGGAAAAREVIGAH